MSTSTPPARRARTIRSHDSAMPPRDGGNVSVSHRGRGSRIPEPASVVVIVVVEGAVAPVVVVRVVGRPPPGVVAPGAVVAAAVAVGVLAVEHLLLVRRHGGGRARLLGLSRGRLGLLALLLLGRALDADARVHPRRHVLVAEAARAELARGRRRV